MDKKNKFRHGRFSRITKLSKSIMFAGAKIATDKIKNIDPENLSGKIKPLKKLLRRWEK